MKITRINIHTPRKNFNSNHLDLSQWRKADNKMIEQVRVNLGQKSILTTMTEFVRNLFK